MILGAAGIFSRLAARVIAEERGVTRQRTTVRSETIRLISVRRSRTKEVRLYEEKKAG